MKHHTSDCGICRIVLNMVEFDSADVVEMFLMNQNRLRLREASKYVKYFLLLIKIYDKNTPRIAKTIAIKYS